MNGWQIAALSMVVFALVGALFLIAIAYVGDAQVNPWPGYTR